MSAVTSVEVLGKVGQTLSGFALAAGSKTIEALGYIRTKIIPLGKRELQAIDPMTTVGRIALFALKELYTKPIFENHSIHYSYPGLLQALERRGTASHEDLAAIETPINDAIKYFPPYIDSVQRKIFEKCILGLEKIQKTYLESYPATVQLMDKHIKKIQTALESFKETVTPREAVELPREIVHWTNQDLRCVSDLLDNPDATNETRCRMLELFLDGMDVKFRQIYKESLPAAVDDSPGPACAPGMSGSPDTFLLVENPDAAVDSDS